MSLPIGKETILIGRGCFEAFSHKPLLITISIGTDTKSKNIKRL